MASSVCTGVIFMACRVRWELPVQGYKSRVLTIYSTESGSAQIVFFDDLFNNFSS